MERDEFAESIIGAALEVHKILGPGLLESIYEKALCYEFEMRGIDYERQVSIDVIYKGKILVGKWLIFLSKKELLSN